MPVQQMFFYSGPDPTNPTSSMLLNVSGITLTNNVNSANLGQDGVTTNAPFKITSPGMYVVSPSTNSENILLDPDNSILRITNGTVYSELSTTDLNMTALTSLYGTTSLIDTLSYITGPIGPFVTLTTNQTITGIKTFSQEIYANLTGTVTGSLIGNASTSTTSNTSSNVVITSDGSNNNWPMLFSSASSGSSMPIYSGPGVTYNPLTSTITATTFSANMAATNVGINWSVFAMSATGTQNLSSNQIYTYCYGAPTSSQTINLPTGTIPGQWISITNLGTSGGTMNIFSGATQVGQLTVASFPNGGNSAMFVYVTSTLNRWIKAT